MHLRALLTGESCRLTLAKRSLLAGDIELPPEAVAACVKDTALGASVGLVGISNLCFSSMNLLTTAAVAWNSSQAAVDRGAPAAPTQNAETNAAKLPPTIDKVSNDEAAENAASPRSDASDVPSSVGGGGATQTDHSGVSVKESATLSPSVGVNRSASGLSKGAPTSP